MGLMSRNRGRQGRLRRLQLPRRLGLLGLALLVIASIGAFVVPVAESAGSSCALGTSELRTSATTECTIVVAGVPRTYLLSLPARGQEAPLVVAFHGLYQTAGGFAAETGLVRATRAAGLALALPVLLVVGQVARQPAHWPARALIATVAIAAVFYSLDLAAWNAGIRMTKLGNATLFGNSASLTVNVRALPSQSPSLSQRRTTL